MCRVRFRVRTRRLWWRAFIKLVLLLACTVFGIVL
jgi:hypothetical protein